MSEQSKRIGTLSQAKRTLLEQRLRGASGTSLHTQKIPKRTADAKIPLSYAQQRMWFLDQLSPDNAFYNIPTAIRITTPFDPLLAERCLNEIIRRHEILRTTFKTVDGVAVQVVAPSLCVDIPIVDLHALPRTERDVEVVRLANKEAQLPFDLCTGPLIRARIFRLGYYEHIFLLTLHHIVSDGWSMGVLARELSTLYQGFSTPLSSRLPELTVQYADFALWQRTWLRGEVLDRQLAYWRSMLANVPMSQLPTDRPRPKTQTFRGASFDLTIPSVVTERLQDLSHNEGATLFMTLLAAFKVLLRIYSGQDDIAIGSYVAGRNRPDIEQLIGFFLNTLVLRTHLSGNPSFRELLGRVREIVLSAFDHQDIPFEKLVEDLQPERDPSRNPLCQVAFQLQNASTWAGSSTRPSAANTFDIQRASVAFDLALTFWESAEGLRGQIEYSTDLFDPATIVQFAQHLHRIMEAIADTPDLRLSELSLLISGDAQRMTLGWNSTYSDTSQILGIVAQFEAQARATPNAVAFRCGPDTLTFSALNERANQLAYRLQGLGVKPEVLVAVALNRSLDLPLAMMAIFKAGGVFMPLDARYPIVRLRRMLEDARASVLISCEVLAARLETPEIPIVDLYGEMAPLAKLPKQNLGLCADPDHLAYVIFTSGSTGRPKGVAVPHRQIINRLQWMWEKYPFAPGEVACQKTAASFVDALWELLGGLLVGTPTVILSDKDLEAPRRLIASLATHGVTRLWLVPSLLRIMLDVEPNLGKALPHLRFWVSSGELLPTQLFARFTASAPDAMLYNLYGTSEIWDATWYVPSTQHDLSHTIPIGRPIANVRTYVLDEDRQLTPIGVPGELYVVGETLARGYLNQPELTAERFIELRLPGRPPERAYRTGDRVRWRRSGDLEYLGRMDHQVNIRGYRVEPGEVEAALLEHVDIKAAAAVAVTEVGEAAHLVAYVVGNPRAGLSTPSLQRHLLSLLPEFMVPSAFVFLHALPLTSSGKVDYQALEARGLDRSGLDKPYVTPRTPVEQTIHRIWTELLRVERIGVQDNFFHLGGHSLLAIRVVSRIRDALHTELPLQEFFGVPTIAGLAEIVAKYQVETSFVASPAIQRLDRDRFRTTRAD